MGQVAFVASIAALVVASLFLPRLLLPRLTGASKRKALLESGVKARAMITSLDQTGTYINNQPKCRIGLRVEPKGAPPFEATATQVVLLTQIPQVQPGTVVTAAFDPNDHSHIVMESLGFQEISIDEAQQMVTESEALEKRLNPAGTPASAIVTAFKPTGVDFNGPNPLAHVEIKVLPEGGEPYDAVLVGVFGHDSLDKYAPGKTVHVRFDPTDPKQVAFDLSKTTTIQQ